MAAMLISTSELPNSYTTMLVHQRDGTPHDSFPKKLFQRGQLTLRIGATKAEFGGTISQLWPLIGLSRATSSHE